ncbi:MAG: beta-propeller fold lactonase family protein [Acidobacteria bacterium]|nr:beta-propeller fold lactonase family protein [Acidobacteriota bacterium]
MKRLFLSAGAVAAAAFLLTGARPIEEHYASPIELALSPDNSRLFVVCEGTDEIVVFDTATNKLTRRIKVGHVPKSIALSQDGKRAWVANSWTDDISEIDTAALEVVRTLPAGFEPNAAIPDASGATLYIANRIGNDIAILDLATGQETKRLQGGRGASYLTSSPDGQRIFSTHIYPNVGHFRDQPESEITVIDARRQIVSDRQPLHNSAGVFHLALTADGRLGMAAELRPKNLPPLAHVEHGAVFTNSIAVFGDDIGGSVHVPIDELDRYFTPPFDIAITPDRGRAFISTTGSDSITVIDVPKMVAYVKSLDADGRRLLATDLSASANYVQARIAVGAAPKGLALSRDARLLYVANRNDDAISVIDTASNKVARTLVIPGPAKITAQRRGEKLFYTARFAFQGHMGCANCHIEATFDGLQWDLEPDGFGKDIVDNRLLEDVEETAPFKWNGTNVDLEMECGPRTEKFFWRAESYTPAELSDLTSFIKAMPLRPNRYRPANTELTASQERGKAIYERTRTKSGAPIPERNQCAFCHSGPHYTNLELADVGSGKPTDRSPRFDTPQLNNIALTGPYLHDGSARTLEEIWTVFNPKDTHGVTNDLAKDELNDLIEYLRTL